MPTPNTITLAPIPGRDYPSELRVLEHLKEGRDFLVQDVSHPWVGKPCNIEALKLAGIASARVRYDRLRKVTIINVLDLK